MPANCSEVIKQLRARDPEVRRWLVNCLEPICAELQERLRGELSADGLARLPTRVTVWAELYLLSTPAVTEQAPLDGDWQDWLQLNLRIAALRHFDSQIEFDPPANSSQHPHSTSQAAFPDWSVRWDMRPCLTHSGDVFCLCPKAPGGFRCFIGDIAGKGVLASYVASGVEALFQWLHQQPEYATRTPAQLMLDLDDMLNDRLPSDLFVAGMVIESGPGATLSLGAGAFPPPLWRSSSTLRFLPFEGMVLGCGLATDANEFEPATLTFHAHDEIVAFSDGYWEQPVDDTRTMEDMLQRHLQAPPSDLFDAVRSDLQQTLANVPQMDDATVVSIRRHAPTCDECPGQACRDLVSMADEGHVFATLLDAVKPRALPHVRRILPNREADVEDAMANATWRLCRSLSQWKGEAPLCYYFRTIACREAINILRSQKPDYRRLSLAELDAEAPSASGFSAAENGPMLEQLLSITSLEFRECVRTICDQLSDRDEKLLEWLIGGKDRKEIAQLLDCTPQNVGYHVRRLLDLFEHCLRD